MSKSPLKMSKISPKMFKISKKNSKLAMKYALARLKLVHAHLCTDLYDHLVGGRLLSYEHKFQIS